MQSLACWLHKPLGISLGSAEACIFPANMFCLIESDHRAALSSRICSVSILALCSPLNYLESNDERLIRPMPSGPISRARLISA